MNKFEQVSGNVFTHICHSVRGGGGGLIMMSLPVWLPGPMFLLGGLYRCSCVPFGGLCPRGSLSRGSLSRGASLSRGVSVRETSRTETPFRTVKSGQYASYWNAFLFNTVFYKLKCGAEKAHITVSRK